MRVVLEKKEEKYDTQRIIHDSEKKATIRRERERESQKKAQAQEQGCATTSEFYLMPPERRTLELQRTSNMKPPETKLGQETRC